MTDELTHAPSFDLADVRTLRDRLAAARAAYDSARLFAPVGDLAESKTAGFASTPENRPFGFDATETADGSAIHVRLITGPSIHDRSMIRVERSHPREGSHSFAIPIPRTDKPRRPGLEDARAVLSEFSARTEDLERRIAEHGAGHRHPHYESTFQTCAALAQILSSEMPDLRGSKHVASVHTLRVRLPSRVNPLVLKTHDTTPGPRTGSKGLDRQTVEALRPIVAPCLTLRLDGSLDMPRKRYRLMPETLTIGIPTQPPSPIELLRLYASIPTLAAPPRYATVGVLDL